MNFLSNILVKAGLTVENGTNLATVSGNVGIGTVTPNAKLEVNGDIITNGISNYGEQYNESYSTNFTNGEFAAFIYRKYTPTTLRNNLNTYNTRFLMHYDLTSASYTGGSGLNATMVQSQMTISGNATTKATQPFTGFSSTLFTPSATAAMNISEFTHFRMRLIDSGVAGCVIDRVYGLFIAQQKGITNYTITNSWGIYQEGSADNNYFNGNIGVGTLTPSFKLDVSGDGRFSSNLRVGSTTSNTSHILSTGNESIAWTSSSFAVGSAIPIRTVIINPVSSYTNLTGNRNTFIGYSAGKDVTSGGNNTFIGNNAGEGVTTGIGNVIIIGQGATTPGLPAGTEKSVTLATEYRGLDASSMPVNRYAFIGGGFQASVAIRDFYFGQMPFTPEAGISNTHITFYSPSGLGTNISGSNFTIAAGRGTGNGTPADIIFSTSTAVASGTTLQTLSNRVWIKGGTGDVVIGGSGVDDASAALIVNSTTQGFLMPRMTSTQKNAIATPTTGLMVYDSTNTAPSYYNGTSWVNLGTGGVIDGDKGDITVSGSGSVWTIDSTAVTYSKIQNVAANSFLANATGSSATVQEIATNRIPLFASAITGTPSASTFLRGDGSWQAVSGSGTVTTISVVSANGFAGTVANATTTPAITLTTTITGLLKGNGISISAAVAGTDFQSPISLTTTGSSGAATFSSNTLNIPTYTLSGLGGQPLATNLTSLAGLTFISTSFVKMTAAGTFSLDTNTYLTSNQTITLSGDVSGSGATSISTTIGNNVVTNAKLSQVATATFKGRTTAGTGNVEDLSGTQATALLDNFTSTLKGLVPASGGGTTNFLRADGTFASTIVSLNGLTSSSQTFANDTNVTITSATSTHTIGWSGQLSIARGGTGASTKSAAYDALNPMTTLGDMIYEGIGPTAVRLAGNTTTTKQFLTQTGTGTVSAAPAWGTILGADVPNFTSTLSGTVPASGGGTTNFLRADGTWAAPSGGGITSLNGLTAATQTFGTGNTGTDVNWSSATSTHTLNIPNASSTNTRGLITNGSQTIGGDKIILGSSSASSGTFALIVWQANTTSILQCRNDGTVLINGTIRTVAAATFTLQGQNTTNAVTISHVSNLVGTAASTGVGNTIGCSGNTGSSDIALQSITGTVNMTTGNTSLVRGLFINPTLTSVAGTYRGLDIVAASAAGNTLMILRNATTTVLDVRSDSKIGFFNAAPVVQPTTGTTAGAFVQNTGTAVNDSSTFSGYTIGSAIAALRNLGLLA